MKINIGRYTLEITFSLTPTEPEWMEKYKDYIREGSLLFAVKLYKDQTGYTLKACKDYSDQVIQHYRKTGVFKMDFPVDTTPYNSPSY